MAVTTSGYVIVAVDGKRVPRGLRWAAVEPAQRFRLAQLVVHACAC
jgi:hypothetical protein